MTIKIEVSAQEKELTQAEVHRIKRTANVLRQDSNLVTITWNNTDRDAEPSDQRYIRETVTNY
jgi:hypothetical protein